jgi:hypothetical protein
MNTVRKTSLTMGWALTESGKRQRFYDLVKIYLKAIFEGENLRARLLLITTLKLFLEYISPLCAECLKQ